MTEKEAAARMKHLAAEITKNSRRYYDLDAPVISD